MTTTTAVKTGTLYGIGVGPGDPELITIKAFRLMKECPVIAYPKKRMGGKSYALEIVELYTNPAEKEMLGLVFPMTKDPGVLEREWSKTVEQCWSHLREGRDIAFVTEGDPNLYSTFIHMARLLQELHPEVPVRSVPGISSVLGAAARLGLPLADGDEQVAIVPATGDRAAMRKAIQEHDAIVFIKVAKVLDMMIDILEELGLADKASVVTKVTSAEERIWRDVRKLRGEELEYLTLMAVRK
ncbi:precorrin-2 C20-methyltransferase [Paenibacillus darwinianus]|uniref:Precorrin-2 C20-methyltransferase n=1 Tax=Paenibacillus darwinianus TaxID=1380763 RepID=A0A9W5W7H9_9BACL|nr:precorrin-2 C(20)-methyltransferase [Paenibacillus darwinianus]EXX86008.1 precorrin-2 C20-methyltransferase [Paenibacillus darwinianus]EXX88779.1 precorrin-2 C20-methyltransferase [Paenibacillus darwinianus]EXX89766.1 precorrin-2 C20-methyltransferase [Paenibacillus darwinianus]